MLLKMINRTWKIRIHRYIRGKPNGKLIWKSIQDGPTPHPMVTDPPPANSTVMPAPRKKLDSEFNDEENKLEMADTQAEIILSQGLPRHQSSTYSIRQALQRRFGIMWKSLCQGSCSDLQQRRKICLIVRNASCNWKRVHSWTTFCVFQQACELTMKHNMDISTTPFIFRSITSSQSYEPQAKKKSQETRAFNNLFFPPNHNSSHDSSNSGLKLQWHDGSHCLLNQIQRKAPVNVVIQTQDKEGPQYISKIKLYCMDAKEKGYVLDAEAESFHAGNVDEVPKAQTLIQGPVCHPLVQPTVKSNEIREFEQIFDELEAEYEQCVLDNKNLTIEKKNLLIKNDCLIAVCLEKDICSIVLTSDNVVPPIPKCFATDLRSHAIGNTLKFLNLKLKFSNYKKWSIESDKLLNQLQGKDDTIRNLETQINITRMLNVGSTEGSCDQQALETDRIQLQDMITFPLGFS
ncbi:hypothetical protein Tco_0641214 [Tanacetum coccineum]